MIASSGSARSFLGKRSCLRADLVQVRNAFLD